VAAALAVVAAGALAGCSGQPGAAAIVDGKAISASDVRVAMDELGPWFQGVTATSVLTVLVQEPTLVAVAAEHGVGVSDAQATDLLDQSVSQQGTTEAPSFSDPSLAVARYSLAYNNLQGLPDAQAVGQELGERLAALDVEVNPRYGTAGDGGQVTAVEPRPWIVAPSSGSDDGASSGGSSDGGTSGGEAPSGDPSETPGS